MYLERSQICFQDQSSRKIYIEESLILPGEYAADDSIIFLLKSYDARVEGVEDFEPFFRGTSRLA